MNIVKISNLYFAPYMWMKRKVFHRNSIQLTRRHLKNENILTKEQKKRARAFYAPYGKIPYTFHAYYVEKTGIFCENYLPTNIYVNNVDDYFNDRYAARYLDNKCYYPRFFNNIPQADTILFRTNGLWFDSNDQMLSLTDLSAVVEAEPALFVKRATNSFGGKGVHYLEPNQKTLYEQLLDATSGTKEDIVVQRPLKQHAALAAINESSVNTIRVISLLSEEGVKCYSTILRMGSAGAKVDNASSGGITCGITPDGKLKKIAYKPSGEKYEVHPTSGLVFDNYVVPGIQEVWETVERAHKKVPHFRLVSWDFAIDENGQPVMIEANLNLGELDFHQLNNGPLFGEDTKKVLDEVFGKNRE